MFYKKLAGAQGFVTKALCMLVIFSMMFSPVLEVFAQGVPPAENAGGSGPTSPDPSGVPVTPPNSGSSSEESLQKNSDSNSDSQLDNGQLDDVDRDKQAQLDSLLNTIDENKWLNSYSDNLHLPDTSHVSGAFTYTVDIHTPPGRNGVQPNLQLKYNSQNKDPENEFGTGWTLNIPYIQQLDKSGTEDLYDSSINHYFTSSIDGDLTKTYGGDGADWDFMAQSNDGSFNKYYFWYGVIITPGAKVVDKNGTIYTYGTTSASQLSDPNNSDHIFRWMLDSVKDVNGNSMVYQYTKDSGQIYPSKIIYTNSATTSAAYTVEFVLENRSDSPFSYKTGFKVSTLKRIARIDVKKNGTLIHKFDFAYTTGQNTVKSLLSSITETGYDEAGTPTALQPITFQYQGWDTTWTQSAPANTPPDLTDNNGKDTGYRIVNYLRDGKTQFILLKDGVTATGYNPPDWTSVSVDNANPRIIDSSGNDKGGAFADINGDLFPDLISSKLGVGPQSVYLWTPSGRYSTTTLNWPPIMVDTNGNDAGTRLGDYNNDGYADYIMAREGYSQNTFLNLADGAGWDNGGTHNMGRYVTGAGGNDYGGRMVDLNGDGLDDYILRRPSDSQIVILWNKGDGHSWEETDLNVSGGSDLAPNITADNGKDIGTRLTDINGDGLVDFVVSSASRGTHFYINMGDGLHWKDAASSTIPLFLNSSELDIGTRFMTGNFDGIPDFVTSSPLATKYNYISNGKPVDVLKKITLPQGGTIEVTYKGTPVDSVVFQTVDTITRNPQISGQPSITDTYTFSAGEFRTEYRNRTFRGFGIVEQTDSLGNSTKTYYYQGNGNNTGGTNQAYDSYALGEYNDTDDAKMYKPFRVERKAAGASYPETVEIYKYDARLAYGLTSSTTIVYIKDALRLDYDGNSTHRDFAISTNVATTTGNVIQRTNWGEVTGSNDGTFTDTGSDKRTTNISYATSSPVGVIGLVSAATTTDQSGTIVNATRHYYDNSAFGLVTKGLETKTEFWKSANSYASTTKAYNVYGLVATSTDARGKSTTYVYDSLFLYPATTTNALGQQMGTVYNYDYGKVKATYDPNNRLYTTTYDGLGRVKDIKQPDLTTPSTLVSKTTYTYTDNSVPNAVQQTDYLNSATSTNTYTYYDGFGRVLQTRANAENSKVVVKDYSYNNRGLKAAESFPYFSTGTSHASATTTSYLYTRYTYDSLKRPTAVANALGTTTTAYDQWSNVVTDALGKYKTFYDDAYNNLVQVDEHATSSTFVTQYQYNGNNLLTKITDALGNIRNFTYDGMGRRLTAEDLRAVADGSYGTWTYTYDDGDNLITVVDPKSQTINYTYDNLSRVLTEDFTGAGGIEISYGYDSCTDGKGRLCAATSTDAVTNLTYNANALVASEKKTINSTAYTTSYAYDRQGNITDITYPDTSIVKYGYDNVGLLDTITRKAPNSSTYNYAIKELQYAPTGAISYKKFGNDVISTYTYDPTQLYRLTRILTVASTTVQGGGGVGGPLGLRAGGSHFAVAPVTTSATKIAKADAQPLAAVTLSSLSISPLLAQAIETLNAAETMDQSTDIGEPVAEITSAKKLRLDSPQEVMISGKSVIFGLTDENSGEDLIVRTDSQDYSGISQADVYFSVENASKVAQSVNLDFFFSDAKKSVSNIERLAVLQEEVPIYSKECEIVTIASSTQKDLTTCDKKVLGTRAVSYVAQTSSLQTAAFDEYAMTVNLAKGTHERKSVNGYVSTKSSKDVIQPGERAYYKATIHFDRGSSGEFFIEAVGDKGGYGHLDPWFSSSWNYRKQITITGSSGAGTGYQVLLKIGETSGASGKQFDLNGHASIFPTGQDQGGDLRFTASDGVTELPFWVEEATSTTPNRIAYVWVKVGENLGTNKDIYVYYGNAGASNASNGFTTFNFFDDFNDGVINSQKWSTVCTTGCNTVDGSTFSSMTESGGTLNQFDQPQPASASRIVATTSSFDASGYAVKRRFNRTDNGTYGNTQFGFGTGAVSMSPATTSPYTDSNNFQNKTMLLGTNATDTLLYGSNLTQNTYYRQESRRISSSKVGAVIWDDNQTQLGATTSPISPSVSDTEYPYMRSADGYDIKTDWILVRKFKETEPAFSSVAAEEDFASSGGGVAGALQDISYTYDAVGNITRITDLSSTNAAKTVNFTYDDLHRLTVASTTVASSTPYIQTYTYNAIGNLANKSDVGSYTYAGTGNANPHAATSVGGVSYTYDNNGNVTAAGTLKYAWDYGNRMTSAGNGTATSTFAYDHTGQRVKKVLGAATTLYPNKYVNVVGATTTDYIYLGSTIIAEIESGSAAGGGGGGVSTSTPAYVQSKDHNDGGPVVLNSSVTTGNLIVVGLTTWQTTIPSNAITDNKGNTYIKVAEAKNGDDRAAIFYAKNVTGGSSFTVSTSAHGTISVHEYSGVSPTVAFDKAASSTGTSASPSSGNVTTTIANELYFGVAWSGGHNNTWTATNGYTKREEEIDNNDFERQATEDRVISTASTTQARFTTSASAAWAGAIATFIPATTTGGGGGGSTGTTTRYFHADILNSTNVVSDYRGNVVQALDYYPYGATRINQSTGGFNEKKQFIGEYKDTESNVDLSYLNARYYNGTRGQFMSEDPLFWEIGLSEIGKSILHDPQSQNSYSYARDNPATLNDPDGKIVPLIALGLIALTAYGSFQAGTDLAQGYYSGNSTQFAWGVVGAATSLIPGGGSARGAEQAIYSVYKGFDALGDLRYIGITSRNVAERAAEHQAAAGTGRELLQYQAVETGLTKTQARIVEQSYIDTYGLQKNGGQLVNKINSISPTSNLGQSMVNSLNGLIGAFSPTNDAQAKALQAVIDAFTK
jgi:RHS repeat-associated protein